MREEFFRRDTLEQARYFKRLILESELRIINAVEKIMSKAVEDLMAVANQLVDAQNAENAELQKVVGMLQNIPTSNDPAIVEITAKLQGVLDNSKAAVAATEAAIAPPTPPTPADPVP